MNSVRTFLINSLNQASLSVVGKENTYVFDHMTLVVPSSMLVIVYM